MPAVQCPALFLTAPASGQGKTTITAALARLLRRQGKVVRVFKTGPDYLDPQILQQASGQRVEMLDMWMAGEAHCQQKLFEAAQHADLILIEGAMGMFDGQPSSADLAAKFNIPMAIVMDVKAMAQTAAAIAKGLASFRNDIEIAGLIANNCGSERHQELIANALDKTLPLLAALKRSEAVSLPERHLGLVQASEIYEQLEHKLEAGANWLEAAGLSGILKHCKNVSFYPTELPQVQPLLQGKTIAIARDAAFSFIYADNTHLLQAMGAKLKYFSPINDNAMPDADALWLPGGYPELHAQALSKNHSMLESIRRFHQQNKTILAECGGFLYCLESLTDLDENSFCLLALMPGHGAMRDKGGCQGMQIATLPEGEVKAHAHHRARSHNTPEPIAFSRRARHPAPGEAIYRDKKLTASFLHLFFPSNAGVIAKIFNGEAKF